VLAPVLDVALQPARGVGRPERLERRRPQPRADLRGRRQAA
jgi:hypothetical protein